MSLLTSTVSSGSVCAINLSLATFAVVIFIFSTSSFGVISSTIDTTYAYGNAYDIIFNLTKSQVMFYDTLKIGEAANIMLGDTVLNVVQTYRYLGHIITNNLSDEADMEDKMRGRYARSNNYASQEVLFLF